MGAWQVRCSLKGRPDASSGDAAAQTWLLHQGTRQAQVLPLGTRWADKCAS